MKKLQDLYELPPQELYLLDLVERCERLESQLLAMAMQLPAEQKWLIDAYIEVRNELEFQSVKRALKFRSF